MRHICFRKELVIGIIILFLAASFPPVFSASVAVPKEASNVDIVEKNELLEIEEESSEMMTVTMVKLCNDNIIRRVSERISVKEYNEYTEKIKACECGDIEGIFAVLQEYGIVPYSIDVNHFIQIMDEKMKKFTFLQRLCNLFSKNMFSISMYPWELECYFGLYILDLEPPVYNFYAPSIFIMLSTYSGGSVYACGESRYCPPGCLLDVMMILYIGICTNPPTPGVDWDGVSCMGFAAYFHASCT